jgi:dihydropteroate synthase
LSIEDSLFHTKKTLNLNGNLVSLDTPQVIGIINVTPDSFYKGSRVEKEWDIVTQAEKMLTEGALALDIGGYSSRPNAEDISIEMEIARVVPAIELILKTFPEAYLSIDTFRSEVAKAAVEAGACIINDISGGELDDQMFDTVADLNVPYILMHMKGNPQTMTGLAKYNNVTKEVAQYFGEKCSILHNKGVKDVILDPGFGFAKDKEQNYELLKNLGYLKMLNLPILAGVSRKSMIYKNLGIKAEDALNGTTALHMTALMNGASMLRVHDVKEAVETVKLFKLTYP